MTCLPKPERRGPKPRRPIPRNSRPQRHVRVARRSARRGQVEALDAAARDFGLDRAGHRCEFSSPLRCSRRSGLDLHHVQGKQAHPTLRWVSANHVILCRRHHDGAHAKPDAFRAWFAAYRPSDAALIGGRP